MLKNPLKERCRRGSSEVSKVSRIKGGIERGWVKPGLHFEVTGGSVTLLSC
jgi:hypothetical protein